MAIYFVDKPEIKLNKPPLSEVVCQVRFPAILRLSKDVPAEFQDAVRAQFPILKVEQGILVQFPSVASPDNPMMESLPKIYRFRSTDEQKELSLAPDFIALTSRKYTHWQEFLKSMELAIQALIQQYQPPYATRIGLRFVNRFTLKNTGYETMEQVLGLFRPELTVMLKTDGWADPIEMLSQILLQDEQGKLTLRTVLGKEKDESFFILDLDYFEEEKLGLENLHERLEHYHARIYAAFRWCVLDESLNRFSPVEE